jgi:ferredoxin
MIITEKKKKEQILEYLKDAKSVFLVGCGRCATSCETGGEKQVAEMLEFLLRKGKKIAGSIVIEAPCDERLAVKELKNQNSPPEAPCLPAGRDPPSAEKLKTAEAVLVLACGAGVQVVSDVSEKPTHPALDSMFLGKTKRLGKFAELCIMCGDCVLDDTGGICPVSRCSKGLLNGPCGGSHKGKCEVDPAYDCGWYLIFERLNKLGKEDKIKQIRTPKDYSRVIRPRKLEIR